MKMCVQGLRERSQGRPRRIVNIASDADGAAARLNGRSAVRNVRNESGPLG